jgi:hypothetical protein
MMSSTPVASRELAKVGANRRIQFTPHAGQYRAWQSEKRFVAVIAGTQSGKTSFGPHWLLREIGRRGPGDYLVVTPTFQLLEKKALPEFKKVFERWFKLGRYVSSPSRKFEFSEAASRRLFRERYDPDIPTVVWFGYAEDPESLESATAKAAWLDEAGQKRFKLASWEAIQRRLAIHEGRVLVTTTPYDLGWLKLKLWNPWNAAARNHPEIDVIRFDSTENPLFPQAEYERAQRELPRWKFDRAIFTRPAGMIYDSFQDEEAPRGHRVRRFPIPGEWKRYLGLDFGNVNMAGTFYAEEPGTQRLFLYRTYHTGGRSVEQHVAALLLNEPGIPYAVGGAAMEDEWRRKFRDAGLPVSRPRVGDVEVGINAVYAMHGRDQILVFDDLEEYLEEKTTYSRELDPNGETTEKIEDKSSFHLLDAERYILGEVFEPTELETDTDLYRSFWSRAESS